jgi:Fe-S cluster assembly protein SufD
MASVLLDSLLGADDVSALPPASTELAQVRRAAVDALRRDGLPGPRDEAWKYTSLRALEQRRYVDGDCGARARAVDAALYMLPGIEGVCLVFVNGLFRDDLSVLADVDGLEISRLGTQPNAFATALQAHASPSRADAFEQLNAALATDGVLLRVAADAQVSAPVQLVFVGASAESDVAWQSRVRIELGERASLRVIEQHVGTDHQHLGNLVADHVLGAHARLDLVHIQDAAAGASLIRRSRFELARAATLSTHTIELGAQLMRHDFDVVLGGDGARFESRGVFALHGRQHADTHMTVLHDARDTACDIVWRGVADQRSRGVFHGAITVAVGADGADAQLSNKNLLLSAQAEIDTQPVLEIYADEVKAAHGATVGQLDERALFYLRSRGLPFDDARRILVGAFCGAVFDALEPAGLRTRIDALLAARLPQAEASP